MEILLNKTKDAEAAVVSFRSLDKTYQLMQKESSYNNMKILYKECTYVLC